ncbi:MAG: hypothetical protein E7Z90_04095 [Cyanobacteria bacterium SIG29]|nr:hypothetical protein [Cyanobacteria bacterium SIG29]
MKTTNVSFGKVIAISGKPAKMKKVNERLETRRKNGQLAMRDVTSYYKNASSGYSLADAAAKGDKVEIYITGDDLKKMNKEPGWQTIQGILGHLTEYYNLAELSISDAVQKVEKTIKRG